MRGAYDVPHEHLRGRKDLDLPVSAGVWYCRFALSLMLMNSNEQHGMLGGGAMRNMAASAAAASGGHTRSEDEVEDSGGCDHRVRGTLGILRSLLNSCPRLKQAPVNRPLIAFIMCAGLFPPSKAKNSPLGDLAATGNAAAVRRRAAQVGALFKSAGTRRVAYGLLLDLVRVEDGEDEDAFGAAHSIERSGTGEGAGKTEDDDDDDGDDDAPHDDAPDDDAPHVDAPDDELNEY